MLDRVIRGVIEDLMLLSHRSGWIGQRQLESGVLFSLM
jgi:hypothetical protein